MQFLPNLIFKCLITRYPSQFVCKIRLESRSVGSWLAGGGGTATVAERPRVRSVQAFSGRRQASRLTPALLTAQEAAERPGWLQGVHPHKMPRLGRRAASPAKKQLQSLAEGKMVLPVRRIPTRRLQMETLARSFAREWGSRPRLCYPHFLFSRPSPAEATFSPYKYGYLSGIESRAPPPHFLALSRWPATFLVTGVRNI